jgi:cytidylate kinase
MLLSKRLKIPTYSIGDARRNIAHARGLTLEEFNRYGETHAGTDRQLDRWQGTVAKKTGRGIFEGRVSYHFIPNSIKIYLRCARREGARRMMDDRRWQRQHEADLSTLPKTEAAIKRRIASDARRYRKYYGIKNIHDRANYDLVINTTHRTPLEVQRLIMNFLTKHALLAKVSKEKDKKWISRHKAHKFR